MPDLPDPVLSDPSQFGFHAGSPIFDFDVEERRAIIQARLRIQGGRQFVKFWDRVLTEDERTKLGDDIDVCFEMDQSSVNLLGPLRSWSAERAIIEIAYRLGHMSLIDYEWLLPMLSPASQNVDFTAQADLKELAIPVWSRGNGTLHYQGKLCRSVKVARATSIVPIFDAFEEAGWPELLEDLVNCVEDPQRVHQVVRNLKTGLSHISFRVQEQAIAWSPTAS
ncbi:hypothetical protein N9Y42_03005 [Mariniblastus sp.]|nr:hypothetical protein [Mariniblastus sp.]